MMHSMSIYLLLIHIINALVIVKIHRDSIYNPQSPCAFIGNISLSNGASMQSCIWQCINEYECQTTVYYKDENVCSMFAEYCELGNIQLSGLDQASVICCRKNHNSIITCSSTATTHLKENEEITTSETMTSTQSLRDPILLTSTNESIQAVWNTTAGGNSTAATAGNGIGNYISSEPPANAFDRNDSTHYTNYGACNDNINHQECGTNTGFYLTLQRGISLLTSLRFCTATNDLRYPLIMTVEASNGPSSELMFGSSWTLIYNGSTGLTASSSQSTYGTMINFPNNSNRYSSYRILITLKSSTGSAVEYSEIELYGY